MYHKLGVNQRCLNREKLYQYCVGIGNEGGGSLVLGITDRPPREIVGTSAFPNVVELEEQLLAKLRFRIEVEQVQHAGRRMVVFRIPSRVAGSAFAYEGAYLMRSGASLVAMTPERLRDIFAEVQEHWVEAPSRSCSADEIIELLDTQTFFELMQQPYPTNRDAVVSRLSDEHLIERLGGNFRVKRLGALLLAKDLDAFPDLGRKATRVVVYEGADKSSTRSSVFERRGYAVGFQRLVEHVMLQMPQNEVIRNALRVENKLLPEAGMRELLANALVHQDLRITNISPTVEIYSNRVEISNAGEPLVAIERFIDGYRTRNESLADLMRRMRICEELGSGVDRLVRLAETWQLPPPLFRTSLDRTQVVIYGPADFDDMIRPDRLRACYQHCVLKHIMAEHMTNQSLRERFGLAESKIATITQVINATIEAGMIKADVSAGDSRRYARYLPYWA